MGGSGEIHTIYRPNRLCCVVLLRMAVASRDCCFFFFFLPGLQRTAVTPSPSRHSVGTRCACVGFQKREDVFGKGGGGVCSRLPWNKSGRLGANESSTIYRNRRCAEPFIDCDYLEVVLSEPGVHSQFFPTLLYPDAILRTGSAMRKRLWSKTGVEPEPGVLAREMLP